MVDVFPIGWIKKSYGVYVCVYVFQSVDTAGWLYQFETSESKDQGGLAEEVSNIILLWGGEGNTTTRVMYWIDYAPRVTVSCFQLGSMDHVFVVPIFGDTVSGYHARTSTIMSATSSLHVTRYITLIHHRSFYTV